MMKARKAENRAEFAHGNLSENELRLLFDNMISAFSYYRMVYDAQGNPVDYVFLAVNRAFERDTGMTRDQLIGRSVKSIYPETEQYWIDSFGRVAKTGVAENITNYSSVFQKWYSILAYSPQKDCVAITVSDITQYYLQRESLSDTVQALRVQKEENYRLAHVEPISGLPNRACLYEAFAMRVTQTPKEHFAIAIFTPDNLSELLGSYGSVLSDRIMRAIAIRLTEHFPAPDSFFSMTGTDLVMLLSTSGNAAHTQKELSRVIEVIRLPVEVDGAQFYLSARCGVASYPSDGVAREDLIMKANLALYQEKRTGHSVMFFSEQIAEGLLRRIRIRNALPKALVQGEFELYFQPQIQPFSDRVLGFEALLRWHSPELGEVAPLDFIGVAEESRMILPIGTWVLQNACATLHELNRQYNADFFIAVNVSGIQLYSDTFVEEVLAILKENGLSPHLLELEITESVLLSQERGTIQKLNMLYTHGVRIALDDFGTGFSSLGMLKDLKITTLKIDKSFVQDKKNLALMEMMIRLGHIIGTQTVAEGVETEEQMHQARRLGSERVQGFLTARPMPLSALKSYISSRTE